MLQGKSATINYKNKKQIEKDKRDWVKVEDTHEGIISKEVFYIANRMLKRDLYNTKEKKTDLFSGMLFCKDCNSPLVRRVVKYKEKEQVFYICSKYNKEKSCTRHSMKKEDLEEILAGIFDKYLIFHENLYRKIQEIDVTRNITDKQIGILQREKEMTQNLLSSLYVDLKEDIISKEEYQMFRENYLRCCSLSAVLPGMIDYLADHADALPASLMDGLAIHEWRHVLTRMKTDLQIFFLCSLMYL